MDLENFEGAITLLCIEFLKLWGGPVAPLAPPVPAALLSITSGSDELRANIFDFFCQLNTNQK